MARYIVRDVVGEDKEEGLLITGEKRVKIRKDDFNGSRRRF